MTGPQPRFASTQWTLVWQAAQEDSQSGRPALGEVMRRYWGPLYSFARRHGLSTEDAEDATQDFLGRILSGDLLARADPARGKFRAYLLTAWKRFLIDEYRRNNAQVRGGQKQILSLDFADGERRWLELAAKEQDPDRLFNRLWADSLLAEVRERLQTSYIQRGQLRLFEALMPCLTHKLDADRVNEIARELDLTPGAIKVAMHRLRSRFGETLRETVRETIDDPVELDAEIAELISVLSSP